MSRATVLAPTRHEAVSAATACALFDAHAHFYPVFGADAFLSAAARNLSSLAGAGQAERVEDSAPVLALVLAERHGAPCFDTFLRAASTGRSGWTLARTGEPESLVARSHSHPTTPTIVLIGARQIVTAEGLEVLALPTDRTFPEGRSLLATLESVLAAGAIPVLPWGVGKWWGKRGRLVLDVLRSDLRVHLCVGDISARPSPALPPAGLRAAAAAGVPVLAGTDPLPIPAHAALAGSYASALRGPFDLRRPAASLRCLLIERAIPGVRGRRCGWFGLLRSQLALRFQRQENVEATP